MGAVGGHDTHCNAGSYLHPNITDEGKQVNTIILGMPLETSPQNQREVG